MDANDEMLIRRLLLVVVIMILFSINVVGNEQSSSSLSSRPLSGSILSNNIQATSSIFRSQNSKMKKDCILKALRECEHITDINCLHIHFEECMMKKK